MKQLHIHFILLLLVYILLLFIPNCGSKFIRESEIKERKQVKDKITEAIPDKITVYVYPLINKSGDPYLDYLSKAVPELLFDYLKPLQENKAYIPFEEFDLSFFTNMDQIVLEDSLVFAQYTTNIQSEITQFNYTIQTNQINVDIEQGQYIDLTSFTNTNQTIITNSNRTAILILESNLIDFEVIQTNVTKIDENRYLEIIQEEFPEMTNDIQYFPIELKLMDFSTNISNDIISNYLSNDIVRDTVIITNTNLSLSEFSNTITNNFENTDMNTALSDYRFVSNLTLFEIVSNGNESIDNTNDKAETNLNMMLFSTNNLSLNFFEKLTTNEFYLYQTNYYTNYYHDYPERGIFISGFYSNIPQRFGADQIDIQMNFVRKISESVSNDFQITDQENRMADKTYDLLKPGRKFILNQPAGDIVVETDPPDAILYIDGLYAGHTPLYYPAILEGQHEFILSKEGYEQLTLSAQILANSNNLIKFPLKKIKKGGDVRVITKPDNINIIVDSISYGTSPVILSNLAVNQSHRIKAMTVDESYKPLYTNIFVSNQNDQTTLYLELTNTEGFNTKEKKEAWLKAYAAWGGTVFLTGANIYTHILIDDYYDKYMITGQRDYYNWAKDLENIQQNIFWATIASGFFSFYMTQEAASKEEIYLGFHYLPGNEFYLSFMMPFQFPEKSMTKKNSESNINFVPDQF